MSLMKALAKVAVGVAVAKGAQSMMRGSKSGGGLGGILGQMSGGQRPGHAPGQAPGQSGTRGASSGGGLEDLLGSVLGGRGGTGGSGGLGGLLNGLGAGRAGGSGGGLQDILGGLLGGAAAGGAMGGGSGGLPRSVQNHPDRVDADFGRVLNSQFDGSPEPEIEPSTEQELTAALMLRAMIQAAKADGEIDAAESERLLGQLGSGVDEEEKAFVQSEMQSPVDVDKLVSQVPEGMEAQIYAVSLLAIDLDHQAEAQYLDKLARGLDLAPEKVNQIHDELGVPTLYT
ncbi:tellurite resistance TerB family protein [Sulfitobacter sp. D35]|uniref:tellurite resistance TerB family protein n=1 Tax=Sulfitobacter sp. D35 TaxID=3083252 RepID=UPI00296F90BE|nr:tellurite resistance TerB family protein [Sulfitobacter sp. D35]MDW4497606.1 tellurite resistance TerB family protein [Sulfitobacter sp. D35]